MPRKLAFGASNGKNLKKTTSTQPVEFHSAVVEFTRYELSKLLPDIITTLLERKCYHTGKGNFLTVEIITEEGRHQNYEIYFVVSRSKLGILTLYIQSAYLGDKIHPAKNSRIKKIGFNVILFNTLRNKPIKPPT